jgi:hypothetical protein
MFDNWYPEVKQERAMSPGKVPGIHQVEQPNARGGRELLGVE